MRSRLELADGEHTHSLTHTHAHTHVHTRTHAPALVSWRSALPNATVGAGLPQVTEARRGAGAALGSGPGALHPAPGPSPTPTNRFSKKNTPRWRCARASRLNDALHCTDACFRQFYPVLIDGVVKARPSGRTPVSNGQKTNEPLRV